MSILFRNAKIITTEKGSMKVLSNAFLGVDGKFIDYIGTARPKKSYDEEIDMYDRLLMPGLVNGHAHTAMNLLKGVGSDLPLQEWLETVWPIEDRMRDEDFTSGMEMAILEMLAGGTTSFSDMYFRPMVTQKCVGESGIKADLTRVVMGGSPETDYVTYENRLESLSFHKEFDGAYDDRLHVDWCVHAEYTISDNIAEKWADEIQKLGGRFHTHLSETRREHDACVQKRGKTAAKWFSDLGFFNLPSYAAHCVWVTDDDLGILKEKGVTIVHNPTSNMKLGSGFAPVQKAVDFNSFGKLYRVMIQGSPETRMTTESLNSIYVRTPAGMAPVGEFCSLKRVYGPLNINRFNLFTSINVTGTVANGYSTGEALKAIEEVGRQVLPAGYTYDFSGLTREEAKASNTTGIIFLLCFIFIYLILSAQYESYILPLSVVLSVPFGLAGCFLFTQLFGHANDIYMQISLIMLIGLLAKNAILIVQFALERRQTGMAISWSAILGAAARLRPILMTSLAMVIGLLPMMFASGVGKNGNQTLGAAAVGGMLLGTLFQIIVVPGLFVIFQTLQEKISPLKFEGEEENPDVATEISQYAHRPVDYELEK